MWRVTRWRSCDLCHQYFNTDILKDTNYVGEHSHRNLLQKNSFTEITSLRIQHCLLDILLHRCTTPHTTLVDPKFSLRFEIFHRILWNIRYDGSTSLVWSVVHQCCNKSSRLEPENHMTHQMSFFAKCNNLLAPLH